MFVMHINSFVIIGIVGWVAFFLVIFLVIRKTKKTQELMAAYNEATKGIDRQKEIDAELAYKKHISQKCTACIVLMVVFALGLAGSLLPLLRFLGFFTPWWITSTLHFWGLTPSAFVFFDFIPWFRQFILNIGLPWIFALNIIFYLGILAFAAVKMKQYEKMKAPKNNEATSGSLFD